MDPATSRLPSIIQQHESELLEAWLAHQRSTAAPGSDASADPDMRALSRDLLVAIADGAGNGGLGDTRGAAWQPARLLLTEISAARAEAGYTATETAMFVLSLKQPLFGLLKRMIPDTHQLVDEIWDATTLLESLALHTTEASVTAREHLIARQQEDMLELSTPVVKLWDGILALPLIGTLDSARTQVVMESLLQRIVEVGAEVAIIDITGVPTVDTLVAQHLIKTVTAARLMGAECIISGIRPPIAATIVHLGVDLSDVATKATLAEAFRMALQHTGHALGRLSPQRRS